MSLLNGFGKKAVVTNTPTVCIVNSDNIHFYANRISVYNSGSADVYLKVNNRLSSDFLISSAIPVIPSAAYEFIGDGAPPLFSLTYATSGSTASEILIGAF